MWDLTDTRPLHEGKGTLPRVDHSHIFVQLIGHRKAGTHRQIAGRAQRKGNCHLSFFDRERPIVLYGDLADGHAVRDVQVELCSLKPCETL